MSRFSAFTFSFFRFLRFVLPPDMLSTLLTVLIAASSALASLQVNSPLLKRQTVVAGPSGDCTTLPSETGDATNDGVTDLTCITLALYDDLVENPTTCMSQCQTFNSIQNSTTCFNAVDASTFLSCFCTSDAFSGFQSCSNCVNGSDNNATSGKPNAVLGAIAKVGSDHSVAVYQAGCQKLNGVSSGSGGSSSTGSAVMTSAASTGASSAVSAASSTRTGTTTQASAASGTGSAPTVTVTAAGKNAANTIHISLGILALALGCVVLV